MLVSTLQMSGADALQDYFPPVSCNGKLLERVTTATILGFHMDKHLTRVDHVTHFFHPGMQHWRFSGNDTTSHRTMFTNMPSSLIVESLVMSKLDYGWVILYPLPAYQMKWLQIEFKQPARACTWADGFCFWGLAKIELATHYWKERPGTVEIHS